MTAWFVDANIFLRFLTVDDQGQHPKAVRFFERASRGEFQIVCGPPVLFELAWTMRAAYKTPKGKILEILSAIYAMPGIILTDAHLVATALTLAARTDSEFADAYIAASAGAAGCSGIATFNRKDFARLGIVLAEL
jgi:predicted nucleic acid-binding protein